jgi:hypothetical protein
MVWNAWGVLYAIFGALITAIQVNQVNNVLGNGFLGFLKGTGDSVMLGLVSIFYALAIALIPFIAKRVISGDVGSTAFALVRAGAAAAGAALAGISGFAAGASPAFAGATASGGVSASTSTVLASSTAPPAPSMPDFIRSGVASAMNSRSSPIPASSSNSDGAGSRGLAHVTSGSRGGHTSSYRPHSVTQHVSYNVGKSIGRAASRSNADNN